MSSSLWKCSGMVHNFLQYTLSSVSSLQIGLMSVTVFPVRLLLVSFFMLLAWPFAFTASLGRSEFVIEPQSWWRRCVLQCSTACATKVAIELHRNSVNNIMATRLKHTSYFYYLFLLSTQNYLYSSWSIFYKSTRFVDTAQGWLVDISEQKILNN